MSIIYFIIAVASLLIMLLGLAGIIFPFLPGIILIWCGIFIYAGITRFEIITLDVILLVSAIAFISLLVDYVSGIWGIRKFNVTIWGVSGGILGGILSSIFNWLPALFIGPFIGAVVGEVFSGRDEIFKIETKSYTIIGFVGGTLVKITAGVSMIGLFVYEALKHF